MSVSALYRRYVTAVRAQPRRAALVMLVLCIAPAIRAGLQELLPSNAPSVRALDEIHARPSWSPRPAERHRGAAGRRA
jgi:hypothetical protein